MKCITTKKIVFHHELLKYDCFQILSANLREKFLPGPVFEPRFSALYTGALTNCATQTNHWAKLEFFSY